MKKEDGGNRPAIKLRELKQYIPFFHFKMESLQLLESFLSHFLLSLVSCLTFSGRPKGSDVSMERNSVPVSMPLFWPCTNPTCFHKTPKDPHGPFKKDSDKHSNSIGRHVDYWQNKGKDYSSTRYNHSFTPAPGICYKSEKVSDGTSSEDFWE